MTSYAYDYGMVDERRSAQGLKPRIHTLPLQPELEGPNPMAGQPSPSLVRPQGMTPAKIAAAKGRSGMRPLMAPPAAPRIHTLPVGNGISPTPPVRPVPQFAPTPGAHLRSQVFAPENSARTQGYFNQLDGLVPGIMNYDRGAAATAGRNEAAEFLRPTAIQGGPEIGGLQGGPAIGGIQGGPAIAGIRGGPAIAGIQGGPAINAEAANRVARGDQLGRGYADYFQGGQLSGGPAIAPTSDPRLLASRASLDQATAKLGGVDRRALAKEILGDFDSSSKEGLDKRMSDAGARAAALGRIGHQGTERGVENIQRGHEKDRASLATQLAADTAAGEISDRQAQAALMRSLVGDEFGYGQATRNEERGERDYSTGIQRENLAATRDARSRGMGFGADMAGAEIGDASNYRNEQRGERDYRTGLEATNRAHAVGERGYQTDLERENRAAEVGERDYRTGLEDRNRSYAVGERDYRTGLERENRAGAVGERDYRTGLELTNEAARQRAREAALGFGENRAESLIGDKWRSFGAIGELANQGRGMDAADRAENRGERGYADARSDNALDRGIQQYGLERQAEQDAFTRAMAQLEAGRYGDPTNTELYGAGEDAAAGGDIMSMIPELMRMFALRRGNG